MFSSNLFTATDKADPFNDPAEVWIYNYDDGRTRVNRRGLYHSIDRWYSSFDEVVPLINALINSGKYKHTPRPDHPCSFHRRRIKKKADKIMTNRERLAHIWLRHGSIRLKHSNIASIPF